MQVDKTLFYLTVILITTSIIFVFSMSLYVGVHKGFGEYHFLYKQLFAGFVGIFIMWFLSTLNPDKLFQPIGIAIFTVFILLMGLMHFFPPNYVVLSHGAMRWIRLPIGGNIAPVEFFKIGFVFFLAWSFSRKIDISKKTLQEDIGRFIPYIALFGLVTYLIAIMQNDFGQVLLLSFVLLFMATMAGISSRVFMLGIILVSLLSTYLIFKSETRLRRIQEWLYTVQDLFSSILPKSWEIANGTMTNVKTQVASSHDAIINGGFWGTGIGNGVIKLGFLPEIHTDFILSGIAEEIGILGLIVIILIYFTIIYRILRIANRTRDRMYSLFAFGIGVLLTISVFINAFGITGIIPIKGIAVPLLSYGGSSMVATCIAIGMILMISKRIKV